MKGNADSENCVAAASLSVTGDASRPISKVRTSFFTVEPSGQMGDYNASEELGNNGHVINNDGTVYSTMDSAVEGPKTNGVELTPQKSTKKEQSTPERTTLKGSPKKKESTPQKKSGMLDGAPSAGSPDKPKPTAEDDKASMLPAEPKEVAAVSGGDAQEGETSPLGSILKGSPFEQDEKKGEASSAGETGAAVESTPISGQQGKSPSSPTTNGKPKEVPAGKAGLKSKTKTASRLSRPFRPSESGKKPASQPASSTTEISEKKPRTSTLPAPINPKNAETPSKQPLPKKVSPKSATSEEPKKEVINKDANKTTAERPSRASVVPKASAAASKHAPKPGKKPGPTSPPLFTKPRPKSPTRPVRLPGSATAPTAASAAKTDAAPIAVAKPRDRIPSNSASLRLKSARTSLPAGSKPAEKAKDKPKSRLSTASSKAPEGSFLDRMMRPTQSSSQKTHEKAEPKSPPRKTNGLRPKRKSDESEKAKSDNVETKGEQPTESTPSSAVQAPADSSEAPNTNGAIIGSDDVAPAQPQ